MKKNAAILSFVWSLDLLAISLRPRAWSSEMLPGRSAMVVKPSEASPGPSRSGSLAREAAGGRPRDQRGHRGSVGRWYTQVPDQPDRAVPVSLD
jgi:hypothetical protein